MDKEQLKKLADLARIQVSEAELEDLASEIGSILNYIQQIEKMPTDDGDKVFDLSGIKNIMRPDSDPHVPGEYTDAILSNAPATERKMIKVKKIL